MKYFKIKSSRLAERYEITPKIFNEVTEHKYPFEKVHSDKSVSQYAICPSCLNPIQIIGIAKRTTAAPYGRHTGKTVDGLAAWNQNKYNYCPYAVHQMRREIDEDELLPEITEDIVELYELLKCQFDRTVYIISKALDIRCSTNFWSNVLKQYLVNKYYCSPRLTEVNLPYLFAYFGMCHNNPFGQSVKKESELYFVLKSHKSVNLSISDKNNPDYAVIRGNKFFRFEFRFAKYGFRADDGNVLKESMWFYIDDLINRKTIYEKPIEFDETYFMNLINSDKSKKYRNQRLLEIAEDLMTPLRR